MKQRPFLSQSISRLSVFHIVTCLTGFIFLMFPLWCRAQQWKQYSSSNSALVSSDVRVLAGANNGSVYAGTTSGLTVFKNGIWQQLNIGNSYGTSIYGVWASNDSLWVGTEYNGLWGYFNNIWKNYDPNTSGNGIVGFGKDTRDSIFRLDKFGNFDLWNGTGWTNKLDFFSQPNNLFIDRYDNVWLLSKNTGMVQYKNGMITNWKSNINPASPGYMPSGSNFDMVQDGQGIYWIAADNGLLRFDGQNFQLFNVQNSGIGSDRTRCLAFDRAGKLWIGTWDAGVSTYDGNSWVTYNIKNSPLSSLLINDILIDTADNIWIANGSNPYTSPSNGQGIYILEPNKDPSDGRVPASPVNLTGKVISQNQVVITWGDSSDNETGFILERSAKDSLHFQQVKFLMHNTTSFNDFTVTDSAYYYRLSATNRVGNSGWSNTIKVQPKYCVVNATSYGAYAGIRKVSFGNIYKETPLCVSGYFDYLNLSTNLFAGKTLLLTVSFDRCNITSDPIIGGVVYIDWNNDGDFSDVKELAFSNININGKGEFSFPVTVPSFVTPGSVIRMRVRAEDDVYSSPISPCNYAEQTQDFTLIVTDIPVSFNAGDIILKSMGSRKIQLTWDDNASSETGFTIQRSVDSIAFTDIVQLSPNTIQYTDSSLQPATRYYYRVVTYSNNTNATSAIAGTYTLPADLIRQWTAAGATDKGFNTGAFWGDYDGDGKFDLYAPGINKLYTNQASMLNNSNLLFHNSSSAAWADFDNDGDQDIFVTNYLYGGGPAENYLYENNGNATFTKRAILVADGRINNVVWTDYNNDGYLDLYVSYLDLNYGKLYRNNKDKTFTMVRKFDNTGGFASFADYDNDGDDDLVVIGNGQSAVFNLQDSLFTRNFANTLASYRGNARGLSWADVDNDGDLDLFVPNAGTAAASCIFINLGGGLFMQNVVPEADELAYGSAWGDYDNDGYQDLYISRYQKTNILFHNEGGTLTELPESIYVNEDFSTYPYNETNSLGCAWADYNNDGFLDLYVAEGNGYTSRLFKNGMNANNWINFLLKGTVSNANGIGAVIKIKANGKWQYRTIQSTSGFAGENSIAAEFGLGTATVIDSIVIQWPSGIVQQLSNIQRNQFLNITEPDLCINNTWTGNADTNWEDPGNWSCGIVPDSYSNVIIPASSVVIINSNVTIKKLKLFPASDLTVNSNYKLTVLD